MMLDLDDTFSEREMAKILYGGASSGGHFLVLWTINGEFRASRSFNYVDGEEFCNPTHKLIIEVPTIEKYQFFLQKEKMGCLIRYKESSHCTKVPLKRVRTLVDQFASTQLTFKSFRAFG